MQSNWFMATRKKNQMLDDIEEQKSDRIEQESPLKPAITSDLAEHRQQQTLSSQMLTTSAVFGLFLGLVGGVVGAVYVAPWYQQNVLRLVPGQQVGTVSNKQIVLDEESAVITAVDKVNPAVVSIVISKDLPKYEQIGSPFGGFYLQVPSPSGQTQKQNIGAGSGFFVSSDGMIVTNKHVVEDATADYTAVTKDGKKYQAKIVATDPFNDLAVLKIDATGLPTVILGDSTNLKLGQRVIAIGNALGQFQNTVTTGVVSGIGRTVTAKGGNQPETLSEVIQTDAAINPGNSGGPLLNLSGEVIGVNTAVNQSAQLIGFAIPIDQVKTVISDVKQYGKVRRAFLGVRYTIVTDDVASANKLTVNYGAWIVRGDNPQDTAVVPGSPADKAGLLENDIILELDGTKITQDNVLSDLLRNHNPGDRVTLKVLSKNKEKTVSVTLGEAQ